MISARSEKEDFDAARKFAIDGQLAGVLLADIKHEPKVYTSIWSRLYLSVMNFLIDVVYKGAAGAYDEANQNMLSALYQTCCPDGEINFFAVDPNIKGKGIGTLLLNELEKMKRGKYVYLFTDSGSAYQFYLRRGFAESGKTDVTLEINKEKVPLTCFLYTKKL